MPGKNKIRYYNSLHQKKYRQIHNQFLAEGQKIVLEVIHEQYPCTELLATTGWIANHKTELEHFSGSIHICSQNEINQISNLETPQEVIAICTKPEVLRSAPIYSDLVLYLDSLRDPGNMGTIIRLADWFGVKQIYAGTNTVDWTNPKVIQASMGSFIRVEIIDNQAERLFLNLPEGTKVMAADLRGDSIYNESEPMNGILIIGNESHGVSTKLDEYINKRIYIPRYPAGSRSGESLNAAVAASLIIGELRRRQFMAG